MPCPAARRLGVWLNRGADAPTSGYPAGRAQVAPRWMPAAAQRLTGSQRGGGDSPIALGIRMFWC